MKEIIFFVITFIITFLLSYFTMIRKCIKKVKIKEKVGKKTQKIKKEVINKEKLPVEINYLVNKYNLDLEKINYKKMLYFVSTVLSIDVAVVIVVISPIKSIYIQILVGFIVVLPLILVTYNSVGNYYIKKGMIKNEHERSRK